MTPVILESPYSGDVPRNIRYLRSCMRDCLLRREAPYASHALYTQPGVLRDELPDERALGIRAGFAWRTLATKTVFYTDIGWSPGMLLAYDAIVLAGLAYEIREIGSTWQVTHRAMELAGGARIDWLAASDGEVSP